MECDDYTRLIERAYLPQDVQDLGRLSELPGSKLNVVDRELYWEYKWVADRLLSKMKDKEAENGFDMSTTKQEFEGWKPAMEQHELDAYQKSQPL
jgi:hypothetical protein